MVSNKKVKMELNGKIIRVMKNMISDVLKFGAKLIGSKPKNIIYYNDHQHKKLTDIPLPDSIPASCGISITPQLIPQNLIAYIKGKVYYCCNTFQISKKLPLTDDLVCDFEDDFMAKFSNKKYDKAQCAYCHCNGKVW